MKDDGNAGKIETTVLQYDIKCDEAEFEAELSCMLTADEVMQYLRYQGVECLKANRCGQIHGESSGNGGYTR